jgi:hypothetical protein
MSGIPALYAVHARQASTTGTKADLDPGIRPPVRTVYRVLAWVVGLSIPLVLAFGPLAYGLITYEE